MLAFNYWSLKAESTSCSCATEALALCSSEFIKTTENERSVSTSERTLRFEDCDSQLKIPLLFRDIIAVN